MKSLLLAVSLFLASLFGSHSPTTPAPAITSTTVDSNQPSSALPGATSTGSLPASFAHSAAASSAPFAATVAEQLQSDETLIHSLANYLAQQVSNALTQTTSAWNALATRNAPHLTAPGAHPNSVALRPVTFTAAVAEAPSTASVSPTLPMSILAYAAAPSALPNPAPQPKGQVLGTSTQVGYVTQDELAAQLNDLRSLISQLTASTTAAFTDPQIAANGNGVYYGATAGPVVQLAGSNITDLTASEIPALDYLSLNGGALSGDLSVAGNSTTTGNTYFAGDVGIGTSTHDALALNGSEVPRRHHIPDRYRQPPLFQCRHALLVRQCHQQRGHRSLDD